MSSLLTLQHDIVYKVITQGLCNYEKSHKVLQYLNVFMIPVLGQIHSYPGTYMAHVSWAGCALMSCLVILLK